MSVKNESEKKELNIEAGKMSLFRTTFQNSLSLEAIKDNKQSSISINKTDKNRITVHMWGLVERLDIPY